MSAFTVENPSLYYYGPGKICTQCRRYRRLNMFHKSQRGYLGYHSICKECKREIYLQATYGLSTQAVEAMHKEQDGTCAICKQIFSLDDLFVDHDHTTQAVRGLLCSGCNLMIGMARDNHMILVLAASYLILQT